MVQLKIAFLDREQEYLEQLKGYLVHKNEMFFQVWTFGDTEAFLEIWKEKPFFDAVVMTEFFWDALSEYALGAKKILLCEGRRKESPDVNLYVAKYQSAETLFGKISAMLWQEEKEREFLPEQSAELIGIYSPVHHESQMLFGITMARILGEDRKTLYVNLMENSGFYRLTNSGVSEDVSDLFYGMMQKESDFALGLHRVRKNYKNFDYIPPAVNPEHLSEISKTLFEQFLMALKSRSGYDVVIVDFGVAFLGFAEMLPAFGSFYCIGNGGSVNKCRIEEFKEYLAKEGGCGNVCMNFLLLPEQTSAQKEENPLENSLYGGMGDYIRRCLYGGPEVG